MGIVVEQDGEGGLLGLAFHPDYSDNGRFFVHYTELSAPLRSRGSPVEGQLPQRLDQRSDL